MSKLSRQKESEGLPVQRDMEKILSSLANEDALKIFQEAKEGITSSTETIKKLRLTQKRYYARLKPLIQSGLIEKRESGYNLTFLGKIIYEILYRKLEKALWNKDRIALIDKLNRTESLSKEEKQQIKSAISIKEKIVGYSGLFGGIRPVEILRSYEELVKVGIDLLENVNKRMFFAARYTDTRIAEAFLRAFERGVKISVLDGDKKTFSKRLNILRVLFTSPSVIRNFNQLLTSVKMKYVDLPYSFAVFDGRHTVFEVTNPADGSFLYGFLFDNEEIAESFTRIFKKLYEKGKRDPFAELLVKKIKNPIL